MMHCPETFPVPLVHLSETDSTNRYLKQLCDQSPVEELTTVVAEFQTSGRGQRGNIWESEAGKNLLFSFVLYPTFLEARRGFLLSQLISLALKEELDQYADGFSIKWPNDIYWHNRKIAGILIENNLIGSSISR
ncbi:MAG: biotin--[acetyl-CoA-carboxylase] ligase, partial [Bacteroides sp.]|nr:biotin--[acetyl-CoA-carboxylase] ligase [Bacteroides sp.]